MQSVLLTRVAAPVLIVPCLVHIFFPRCRPPQRGRRAAARAGRRAAAQRRHGLCEGVCVCVYVVTAGWWRRQAVGEHAAGGTGEEGRATAAFHPPSPSPFNRPTSTCVPPPCTTHSRMIWSPARPPTAAAGLVTAPPDRGWAGEQGGARARAPTHTHTHTHTPLRRTAPILLRTRRTPHSHLTPCPAPTAGQTTCACWSKPLPQSGTPHPPSSESRTTRLPLLLWRVARSTGSSRLGAPLLRRAERGTR